MKLETFFNRFDDLADTPKAVSKMRELILQLAAHGKLVEQSSEDEPASALVSQIEMHIEGLRSRKEFRGSPVEPLDREELPDIPSSWEWVRLGNVVDYGSSDKAESAEIPSDAWLLDLEDIEKDTSRLLQRKSFRDSPSKSTKTAFVAGDVLYGKLRPYLNKAIVADAPGYCTTEIIPIRAFGFIDPVYLCNVLKRPEFIAYANSKSYGMNLPRLGTEDARRAPLPLPPLAEQKRIVAKVDELMGLCERLEAQQQGRETRHAALARASLARFADAPTQENLNYLFHPSYTISPADLRKSILTLAVRGKLVPQDANDEPVEELLKRCFAERRKLKRTIDNEVRSLSTDNALGYEIPESWRWQRLDDLLIFGPTNGFSPKSVDYETPVRSLSLSATTSGRFKGEHSKFITTEVPEDSDLWLRDGDILVQRGNTIEYVGVAAIYRGKPNCFVYPDLMMKLRVSSAIDVDYIHLAMSHEVARDFLRARASGTSGSMPKINQTTLKSLPLPIPPLAEQRRIVAKVEQLMALVDALETQLAASRVTAANLLSALVAELTGTPNNRHASVSSASGSGRRGRPRTT